MIFLHNIFLLINLKCSPKHYANQICNNMFAWITIRKKNIQNFFVFVCQLIQSGSIPRFFWGVTKKEVVGPAFFESQFLSLFIFSFSETEPIIQINFSHKKIQIRITLPIYFFYREEASKRRQYDALIERVFRPEDQQKDRNVSKVDIEVLEKEISIGKYITARRKIRASTRSTITQIK